MTKEEIAYRLTLELINSNKNDIFSKISESAPKNLESCAIETVELINKIFNSFYENLSKLN